ncbi:MAG: hypothetical protein A49_07500 [Methyloceanibacter sp.]|nr:MAG: hypothetical protein A49_07500 [Methyloceanibacter sp.]
MVSWLFPKFTPIITRSRLRTVKRSLTRKRPSKAGPPPRSAEDDAASNGGGRRRRRGRRGRGRGEGRSKEARNREPAQDAGTQRHEALPIATFEVDDDDEIDTTPRDDDDGPDIVLEVADLTHEVSEPADPSPDGIEFEEPDDDGGDDEASYGVAEAAGTGEETAGEDGGTGTAREDDDLDEDEDEDSKRRR